MSRQTRGRQIRRKNLRVDKVCSTEAAAKNASKKALKKNESQTKAGPTLDAVRELYQASLAFKQKKPATQRSEQTHIKEALRRFGERPVAGHHGPSSMQIYAHAHPCLDGEKAERRKRAAVRTPAQTETHS